MQQKKLPPLKFEIYDDVKVYRTELDRSELRNHHFKRTTATGEKATVMGYAITEEGKAWEYFINVHGTHSYNKWVREIALEMR